MREVFQYYMRIAKILSRGIRIVSRRAPSLGRFPLPYDFQSKTQRRTQLDFTGNYKCGVNNCPCCPCILKGDKFWSTTNNREFTINCDIRNVIYLITCRICSIQYIGRTMSRLRDRLKDHLYNIEKEHGTNVARHFNNAHRGDISALQIQGIEKFVVSRRGDLFRTLCKCEVFLIFHIQIRIPSGVKFWMRFHPLL